MKKKIRRRCGDGCGRITNWGKKYIHGHNRKNKKLSKATTKKMSLAAMGNTNCLGYKHSKEAKLKMALSNLKYNPNYEYCDIWKDRKYRKDLRKDYCENANCKKTSTFLVNHHIHLDKKRCAPNEIMTLCASCHIWLHHKLKKERYIPANPKDFIIINRPDHVSYIHKATRKIIRIERV